MGVIARDCGQRVCKWTVDGPGLAITVYCTPRKERGELSGRTKRKQLSFFSSRSPFLILLRTFASAEGGDFTDQSERKRLVEGKLDRTSRRGKFREILRKGADCGGRGIEADVMLVRGEGDEYPPIGKRRHPPLQAFLGAGRSFANTGAHFAQFLLSVFRSGTNVLGDAFGSRFFCSHDLD
jgi:hypothetical protein